MQVKSKDPKHLFSLDNLLDFFFIKRLTLQTVQSNIASCEESMTPALYWKMRWGRKKKQVWRWDRYRNKDWGKKNQGIGRNVEGNNTVWTFLFTQMNNITTLSSGLLSTPARDVHVRQTFAWLPGSHDYKHSTEILQCFSFAFSVWGGQRGLWWVGVFKECQG